MQTEQRIWTPGRGWSAGTAPELRSGAQLVLLFGDFDLLKAPELLPFLSRTYPQAQVLGCSSFGGIHGTQLLDEVVVLTAVRFEHTLLQAVQTERNPGESSLETGKRLAQLLQPRLPAPHSDEYFPLLHVLVLADGLGINGSLLVAGMSTELPVSVGLTGGLASDAMRFKQTCVVTPQGAGSHTVRALGFYSHHLKVGFSSESGWDPFGPERLITRSQDNVLYEVDGRPALELYKLYLGEHARGLPATALFFPLSVRPDAAKRAIIRGCLSINEADESMTFAGDVPQNSYARLMRTNINRVLDGAVRAAEGCQLCLQGRPASLALLISCGARRQVLQQRTEEELEAVRDILGSQTTLAGFYSFGEIAPFAPGSSPELHNQTMTITTFTEA